MDILNGAGDLGAKPVIIDNVKDSIRIEIGDALIIVPTLSPDYSGGPRRILMGIDEFNTLIGVVINGSVR